MKRIILEGTDGIGKSTICNIVKNLNIPIIDRAKDYISKYMMLNYDFSYMYEHILNHIKNELKDDLIIILYSSNPQLIEKRINEREILSDFDKDAVLYNELYIKVFNEIIKNEDIKNVKMLDVYNKSLFENINFIITEYVTYNYKTEIDFTKPIIEGESKKIFKMKDVNLALVELKPTMYSFTHNRYGIVEGTDTIRVNFWELFGSKVNSLVSERYLNKLEFKNEKINEMCDKITLSKGFKEFPFISNYIGRIKIENKDYVIIKFFTEISPLEIVWKKYFLGTMKHNLKIVDKCKTKDGKYIKYEEQFPDDFVRFDWRNPLPDKDECIPDDFAEFYIDSINAKNTCKLISYLLNEEILNKKQYELADICYFMSYEGNVVCSEITPDGMRIKKNNSSFDKDLWRLGKDKTVINTVWQELYDDLKEI